jgi:hypothetical protein
VIVRWLPYGFAGLLFLVLLTELLVGQAAPAPGPTPMPVVLAPPAAANVVSAALSAQWSAAILARPLFRATRRPLPPAAVATADVSLPRLSAIVITAAGSSAIFITDDGTAAVVATGGRIGAYTVLKIEPDMVRLVGPSGIINARPQFATAAAPDSQ